MRVSPLVADFHQSGGITTLHRFGGPAGDGSLSHLERELCRHAASRPIALVLPCLYGELQGGTIPALVDALKKVEYLDQVVVVVDGASRRDQFEEVYRAFQGLPTRDGRGATMVWSDGPGVEALLETMRKEGLEPGLAGKGRATWLAYGVVLAVDRARVVAVHDCDIRDYDRELLARLCFPTVHPNLNFEFAKGFYCRVVDRMFGRVTRLFVAPLLGALESVLGTLPLLEFLHSFRYPLAGEVSMTTELARVNRVPGDWGLEVGVLAEVFRNCSRKRVCQVELIENYDHKHRELSPGDPSQGLHRMAQDIGASLVRNLASYGVSFDAGFLNSLEAAYLRTAQDAIASYHADAELNGLLFDRHEEELAVETFSRALHAAGLGFVLDPMGGAQIPNWSRVCAAWPQVLEDLQDAVETDGRRLQGATISGGMA